MSATAGVWLAGDRCTIPCLEVSEDPANSPRLSARPFGGVFDDLLNHDLGLDGAEEQFLLAVLVGHTGATAREPASSAKDRS